MKRELGGKTASGDEQKYKALVFDASGITRSDDLVQVYHFFHRESCPFYVV